MSNHNYFDTRIKELDILLDESGSKTSKSLITEAKQLSEKAFKECVRVSKAAKEKIIFLDNKKSHFDSTLASVKTEFVKLALAASNELFSQDTRKKIAIANEAVTNDIQYQYDVRVFANRSLREAISFCSIELEKVLLELIYRPNPNTFIVDSVVDVLKTLVQKLIPYSDDIEKIFELNISNRKKNYLSQGDKLLSYLEDYISVLNNWIILNGKFEKEVVF